MAAAYAVSLLAPLRNLPTWQSPVAGAALTGSGLLIAALALSQFIRAGTQVSPTSAVNDKLVVSGVFRLTRNPMYLGLVILTLGVALWVGRPMLFAVPVLVFAIANWAHIPFEEAKMRRQFGASYDAYCTRVRRWI